MLYTVLLLASGFSCPSASRKHRGASNGSCVSACCQKDWVTGSDWISDRNLDAGVLVKMQEGVFAVAAPRGALHEPTPYSVGAELLLTTSSV